MLAASTVFCQSLLMPANFAHQKTAGHSFGVIMLVAWAKHATAILHPEFWVGEAGLQGLSLDGG